MRTDEDLYIKICEGDQEAFRELYARYESPLLGFLIRRLGNREEAEEIFQDLMLAVLKNDHLSFAPGGFAAWIYRVAINKTLTQFRNRKKAAAIASRLTLTEADHGDDASKELISAEEIELLSKASLQLTPALKQVFEKRQAGKSYEETATELGIPIGSVKSRIHAMVTVLRKELIKWNAK